MKEPIRFAFAGRHWDRCPRGLARSRLSAHRPHSRRTRVSYIQKTLIAGETVLYRAHLHWVVLLWHALIGMVLVVVGVALLTGAFAAAKSDHTSPLFGAMGGGFL